jgi:hypothetical protein
MRLPVGHAAVAVACGPILHPLQQEGCADGIWGRSFVFLAWYPARAVFFLVVMIYSTQKVAQSSTPVNYGLGNGGALNQMSRRQRHKYADLVV